MKKNILTFPSRPNAIDAQLKAAIANKRLIRFSYNNQEPRVAEPHDYGLQNGIDQLLVYQRKKAATYLTGWRSLEVSKIENLVVLEEHVSRHTRPATSGPHGLGRPLRPSGVIHRPAQSNPSRTIARASEKRASTSRFSRRN